MDEIRLKDAPVRFTVTCKDPSTGAAVDISLASALQFYFRRPDDSSFARTGSFTSNGSDGKVYYVTQSDEINQVGIWEYQLYVTLSGGVLHTEMGKFRVKPIIA